MQILRLYNGKYLSDVFFSLLDSDQMTLFLFDSFSWASRLLSSFYVCLAPLRNTQTCKCATCIWKRERNALALMNEGERKWNIHLVGLIIDLLFSLGEIFYIYLWLWIILTYKVFICQENDPWKVYVCTVLPPHLGLRRSQTIPPEGFIAHLWAVIEQSSLNIILGVIDYRHSSIFVDLSRSTSADVKQITQKIISYSYCWSF